MQNMSKIVILVNFQRNREYIAKNLCVKKEIKGNCCQGGCHLTKELQKEEKKEAPANSFLKDKSEMTIFCQQIFRPNLLNSGTQQVHLTPYSERELQPVSFSIFHPPSC